MLNASYIDNSQIGLKSFIMTAIYLWFGWQFNASTGKWSDKDETGKTVGRPLPKFDEKLGIRPIMLYHRIYAGDSKKAVFFDQQKGGTNIGVTNQDEVNANSNTLRVFAGWKLREEVGAAAPAGNVITEAEIADLVFDDVNDNSTLNGTVKLQVSGVDVYKNDPIGLLFDNGDGIKNYARFDSMKVQEPGEKIEMEINTPDDIATKTYYEAALVGFELTVKKG